MRIVIVTNIPAPYRVPIYELLNKKYGSNFLVVFCAKSEANRQWELENLSFNYKFLKENSRAKKDGFNFVHNNFDVIKVLKDFRPDVIITTGFNPTHLYAWLFSKMNLKKHICMTDGWIESEKKLSIIHKIIRKIVFSTSKAFIGASKNSLDLYRSYNISDDKLFQSPLCIDNERFYTEKKFESRDFHLMFSGQFIDIKMPLFFAKVAYEVSKKINGLKLLIIGDGPLKIDFFNMLNKYNLDYYYAGFVSQDDLPIFYSRSKILLFPTKHDSWGIVVNESMASRTPVITTKFAGVVNDLVIDNVNGNILDISIVDWSVKIIDLLNNKVEWEKLSEKSIEKIKNYNFEVSVDGIIRASEFAYKK